MTMKKHLPVIIILTVLLAGSQSNIVQLLAYTDTYSLPYVDGLDGVGMPGDVLLFLGNELESISAHEQPVIDIDTLSFNDSLSQLELDFFGTPILDPYHEYRIFICWNTYIGQGCEGAWGYLNWDLPIYETTNVTLCVAGGASWFGTHNGSYNSFVNVQNETIFLEQKNDSVIIEGQTLIFPINTTFIPSYDSPAQILVYTLFNDPNETIRTIWFDALPNSFNDKFFMLTTTFVTIDLLVFTGLFVFVSVCHVAIVTRKRRN